MFGKISICGKIMVMTSNEMKNFGDLIYFKKQAP